MTYSDLWFDACTFDGNSATNDGGAIHSYEGLSGSLDVTGSMFSSNSASDGGALWASRSDTTMSTSSFTSNMATGSGGAISLTQASLDVSNSSFVSNQGDSGGGILLSSADHSQIRNTEFQSNVASSGFGGAVATGSSWVDVFSSRFDNNDASLYGGALGLGTGYKQVFDCTFTDNTAGTEGGAIRAHVTASSPLWVGSTSLRNNVAADIGGIFLNSQPQHAVLRNLVLWGNGGDVGGVAGAPSPTISNVCSEFFLEAGGGNLVPASDPFVAGPDGELFLLPASVCVDAGDSAAASTDYGVIGLDWADLSTQMDGSLDAGIVDMGAHYAVE